MRSHIANINFLPRLSLRSLTTMIVAVSCISAPAFAQTDSDPKNTFPTPSQVTTRDEWKPHVGFRTGYAGTRNDFDSAVGYGLDIGFQPYIPFGVGFELSRYTTDRTVDAQNEDLERTSFLARGTYNFGGQTPVIRHSYVGASIGAIFDRIDGEDSVKPGIAPVIGFDIPVATVRESQSLTLGASAAYLIVDGSNPDVFSMNGQLKYWF